MNPVIYQIADVTGLIGVAFYLGSYAALQMGKVNGGSRSYTLLNLAAASCVLVSLVSNFNLSSLLVQLFWIGISLYGLARLWGIKSGRLLTPIQQDVALRCFPDLSSAQAAKLFAVGQLVYGENDVLTHQGNHPTDLILLVEGAGEVFVDGRLVEVLRSGSLIGEYAFNSAQPATATVRLNGEGQYFRFDVKSLKKVIAGHSDLGIAINSVLLQASRQKLMTMNSARVA